VSTDQDWSAFTPKLALDYFITEDKMVYGSISRGFKSGGFQGTPPTGEIASVPYDEEFAWAYEIGAKTRWMQDRLQLNLAIFRTDHEDLQVAELIAGDRIVIGNAAEAEINGLEVELLVQPAPGLTINGSYAYLDAEFSNFAEGATADNTGNTLPRSPENAFNLGFQYDWGAGSHGTASARVDWSYQDDFFFEASNTPNEVQKAYDSWDARLAFASLSGVWEVALWGKNLSDELIKTHSVAFAPFGQELVSYAEPRTYGVTFTWNLR
jgi:iron complex outermembrane receptor protein